MYGRFLQCVLVLALMASCSSKNSVGFVQLEDPAGKLVVSKNKAGSMAKRVSLQIEGKSGTVCATQVFARTALDAVKNAAKDCGYTYHIQDTQYGPLLDAIGDDVISGLQGWWFTVNNTLPEVGAADYTLKAGDKVVWRYGSFDQGAGEPIDSPWPVVRATVYDFGGTPAGRYDSVVIFQGGFTFDKIDNEYWVANVGKYGRLEKEIIVSSDATHRGGSGYYNITIAVLGAGGVYEGATWYNVLLEAGQVYDLILMPRQPIRYANGSTGITDGGPRYPVVRWLNLPATHLAGGATSQAALATWSIEAVGGETRHKKISFEVAWFDQTPSTELVMENFKLYRNGSLMPQDEYSIYDGTGGQYTEELSHSGVSFLGVSRFPESRARVIVCFASRSSLAGTGVGEEIVAIGKTNEYSLRVDIRNAHAGSAQDSDYIAVRLLGDDRTFGSGFGDLGWDNKGIVVIGQTDYNFIWSNNAAQSAHSSAIPSFHSGAGRFSSDWSNGYEIPFLPLDHWMITK